MPEFTYKGRDKTGQLRVGQRSAENPENLNSDLMKEGIFPIQITLKETKPSIYARIKDLFQSKKSQINELAIFSRQMEQLQNAGVPIVASLRQLATFTKSKRIAQSITGVVEYLEKGQNLATAMRNYPDVFTPLMTTIVSIGENTGHLGEAFKNLHQYLEFELNSRNQISAAFRYPLFILVAITFAIIVLNVFVIPTFARFYTGTNMSLPWQTKFLIAMSNITIHYGVYILIAVGVGIYFMLKYFKTPKGKYNLDKFKLRVPIYKNVQRHIILIRFSQALAIILNSGIQVNHALELVRNVIQNSYIDQQIVTMQKAIESGNTFTQAIANVDLFTPLELQIISVGEKNGQLGPALSYISSFHNQEIEYELKRLNDSIGPILIGAIAGLILIIALGVYLPIWNMVNLAQQHA